MAHVGIRDKLSKDNMTDSLKNLRRLRLSASHGRIISLAALFLILFIAFTIRVLPLRWEIPQNTVRLNEFDPYYQFILTRFMVQNGPLSPYLGAGYIEHHLWYPAGLDMTRSLPGLPMLTAVLYDIMSFLGINVDLMAFASFMPAIMGTITVLLLYFLGKDFGGKPVGLLAALFLALSPGYIQRTALGFYDTEVPGIFSLILFVLLFLRANDENRSLRSSMLYTLGSTLTLAFFVLSWGAAYYLTGLVALFAFVIVILKRYTPRLLITYSIAFGGAFFIATKFQQISLTYLTTGPVIPVAAVFLLLCLAEVLRNNISIRTKTILSIATIALIVGAFVALWQFGLIAGIAGKFVSIVDPFLREANPLIASVAEHRISTWSNMFYDFGIGLVFFVVGLYFTLRNPTNRNVFLLIFGLTALYFGASMVRILAVFAPVFAILAGMGIVGILKPFYTLLREAPRIVLKTKRGIARVSKEYSGIAIFLIFIILVTNLAFMPQNGGTPRVYGSAYVPIAISASSLPIAPNQPVLEWVNMLSYTSKNLNSTDVVCSWWDYGYWLGILGNVTTLADNATVNATQIENIGYIMMANETQAIKVLKQYDAKYILVFVTLAFSQTSQGGYVADFGQWGDEAKWFWMARISGDARNRFINEGLMTEAYQWTNESAFGTQGTSGWNWNDMGTNSTVYKLMSYAKDQWGNTVGSQAQITTNIGGVIPTYFKEKYFSGLDATTLSYGGIVPLVALYEIDYAKYNADFNMTG
ncbi:MAG TPA: STT3 domain-containing protein [Candidatus Sulfotelmatobacter sp.]|nr:STT3 domain-containing protein [Candidatus Sulfotelmatobacter sp.]